jgi:protein TonB
MEAKKSIEADVSNARVPFGINGVLFIAGITLASFSFTTPIIEEAEKEQVEQKKDKDVEEADDKKADVPPPPPAAAAAAAPVATIDMAQAIDENTVEIDNTGEVKTDISTGTQSTAAAGDNTNAIDHVDVIAPIAEEVVDVPDVEASFPGGSPSAWFASHIVYPEIAQENGDEGTVLVTFVVEKDGRLTSVAIPKGRGQTPELDAEAIKKVRMMPNWTPGQNNGNACRSKFQVKVVFKLG